ncbi:MAG: hypothetical protein R3D51_14375 [Hyphomicrobiaceae bacterium]
MSTLWDVPQYLIMAFSLAFHGPVEKASRVSLHTSAPHRSTATAGSSELLDESAWLRAVKTASPSSDILALYGARIFQTSSGRYYVATQGERSEILALRDNEEVAARVMAAATLRLRSKLVALTGRSPTPGALLVAHVAGIKTSIAYMHTLARDASMRAGTVMPALAPMLRGNRTMTLAALDERLREVLDPHMKENAAEFAQVQMTKPLKGSLAPKERTTSSRMAIAD